MYVNISSSVVVLKLLRVSGRAKVLCRAGGFSTAAILLQRVMATPPPNLGWWPTLLEIGCQWCFTRTNGQDRLGNMVASTSIWCLKPLLARESNAVFRGE